MSFTGNRTCKNMIFIRPTLLQEFVAECFITSITKLESRFYTFSGQADNFGRLLALLKNVPYIGGIALLT